MPSKSPCKKIWIWLEGEGICRTVTMTWMHINIIIVMTYNFFLLSQIFIINNWNCTLINLYYPILSQISSIISESDRCVISRHWQNFHGIRPWISALACCSAILCWAQTILGRSIYFTLGAHLRRPRAWALCKGILYIVTQLPTLHTNTFSFILINESHARRAVCKLIGIMSAACGALLQSN